MLTRQHGAELCYTPMLHSRLFAESPAYREKMFEQHIHDRPLIVQVCARTNAIGCRSVANALVFVVVQFCGNDPQTVLAAAKHVEGHCDAVDLNLGCPQV